MAFPQKIIGDVETELRQIAEDTDAPKPTIKLPEPPVTQSTIIWGVVLYAACSSTLLVINKVAIHLIPDASFVLLCQFVASAAAVSSLRLVRPDMDIEELKWEKVKPFSVAVAFFFMCLLCNTQALKFVNVESVIVFRSCSPIAVALLDRVALGKELPNPMAMLALCSLIGGAVIYCMAENGVQIGGYFWLCAYFVFIVIEMVFVKFVVDTVEMSTWTRVYYNNLLSVPMAILSSICMGDFAFTAVVWTGGAITALILSCVVGVIISFAGFNLRKLVSATTFTVVGVVCKVFTILINDLIWKQHSNAVGHLGLGICIASGFMYERLRKR